MWKAIGISLLRSTAPLWALQGRRNRREPRHNAELTLAIRPRHVIKSPTAILEFFAHKLKAEQRHQGHRETHSEHPHPFSENHFSGGD